MKNAKQPKTPLDALLRERMAALGLDATAVGHRLGYTNPVKAAGRVQALGDGFFDNADSRRALTKLAAALDVDEARVTAAVDATRSLQRAAAEAKAAARHARREAEEAAYRRDFQPHAVLVPEFTRPWSIVGCLFTGGPGRWLRLALDVTQPPETFLAQARALMEARLTRTPEGDWQTPFFGRVVGVTINLTPDDSLDYDVTGRPLGHRPRSVRLGGGSVAVAGRGSRSAVAPLGAKDT